MVTGKGLPYERRLQKLFGKAFQSLERHLVRSLGMLRDVLGFRWCFRDPAGKQGEITCHQSSASLWCRTQMFLLDGSLYAQHS